MSLSSDDSAKSSAVLEVQRLRANERRFRQMAENAPGFQYVIDLRSQAMVFMSRDGFLGYSREELSQTGFIAQLIHPADADVVREHGEQALAGQGDAYEYRLRSTSGEWEWVRARAAVLRDLGGDPVEMVTYLSIVTESRQTIEALANSQRRIELLVQSSGQIIYDYAVATGEMTWSGAVEPVLGFRPDEMEGGIARWGELIADEDAMEVFRMMEDAERACASFGVEYRLRRKDDSYVWVFDRGFFLPGEDGRAERMLGIMQDITERRETEQRRNEVQETVIAAQQATLRELSTPLIPLRDDIVVMPLVGALDSSRAQQIMETLLEGVARQGARAAILDITGVSIVDTQVANALLQAAQAVRLLGAQVVLTGIRPEVAQTLVGLGVDLEAIVTCATLQDGIATVMRAAGPRPRSGR
jgi:anti-anti-sigma factor